MNPATNGGSGAGGHAAVAAGGRAHPSSAEDVAAWRSAGEVRRILRHDLFAVRAPAADPEAEARTPLCVLHGFPTSCFDFRRTLPRLCKDRPVVLHDHLGFGLSAKPEPARFSYSLLEQTEIAVALWQSMGITRCHVVAHDYGTSIATELCALRARGRLPIEMASLTLCNGSVYRELAQVTRIQLLLESRVGPLVARLSSRRFFARQMRRIVGRREAFDDREIDLMWELLERDDGRLRAPAIVQYLGERVRFRERWIGALTRLDLPVYLLWGRLDPVAVPAIPEKLARDVPGARLEWLDDLGHYPMVEDPERWADRVATFVRALETA
jgi:pimeloyl-ACP methyl ester carboxylesterase